VTTHNDRLPEDVLLEVFDAYRKDIKLQPLYESVWNSRDGWFKLAHVCLHWRRVVLLSPSRLRVRLLFTPHRSSKEPMLGCLPRFPILVDYIDGFWTENAKNLAIAAIRYRSRVHGITLLDPPAKLLRALGHPFPELESLKIYALRHKLILPATFLSGSTPRLRRLTLCEVASSLSPTLSLSTGLVELALYSINYAALPEASLFANLQRMSCLRRLELKLRYSHKSLPPPTGGGDVITLSKLTDLIFLGPDRYLQMFVVRLAAPSLQHLDVEISGGSGLFSIPHLGKFICDAKCLRLSHIPRTLAFSAETCSRSDRAQLFRIVIPNIAKLEEIGNMLSGSLSTVEELVVESIPKRRSRWRGFCHYIQRVKVVQVSSEVALDFARSFRLNGQQSDLLPALERVKVDFPTRSNMKGIYKRIRKAFGPLVAARQRVGRPILLSYE
jgi:hypothetical protein